MFWLLCCDDEISSMSMGNLKGLWYRRHRPEECAEKIGLVAITEFALVRDNKFCRSYISMVIGGVCVMKSL